MSTSARRAECGGRGGEKGAEGEKERAAEGCPQCSHSLCYDCPGESKWIERSEETERTVLISTLPPTPFSSTLPFFPSPTTPSPLTLGGAWLCRGLLCTEGDRARDRVLGAEGGRRGVARGAYPVPCRVEPGCDARTLDEQADVGLDNQQGSGQARGEVCCMTITPLVLRHHSPFATRELIQASKVDDPPRRKSAQTVFRSDCMQ